MRRASVRTRIGAGALKSALVAVVAVLPLVAAAAGTASLGRPLHRQATAAEPAVPGSVDEAPESSPFDAPDAAAAFYVHKRSPDGRTPIAPSRYSVATAHTALMPVHVPGRSVIDPAGTSDPATLGDTTTAASALVWNRAAAVTSGSWAPLGPSTIGGRTRDIVIDPTTPTTLFAASDGGGIWKSTNAGSTWTTTGNLLPSLVVSSLAMDPRNSAVLYAGTGDGYWRLTPQRRGAGVLTSSNGGTTWTTLASTSGPDFFYVNDVLVSPANSSRIYAATRTGVWRSTDAGVSWTRVLTVTSGDPFGTGCLHLVARTDTATDTVFASCGLTGASVWRNTDAGGAGAWQSVLSEAGMANTTLAIAPSDQSVVYALSAEDAAGPRQWSMHAVFRSTAGGAAGSWAARVRSTSTDKLSTTLLSNPLLAFYGECGYGTSSWVSQGYFHNAIAVDPKNSNRVLGGGIDLFRSDDGGTSWGLASYWWADGSFASPQYAHADKLAIVFDPRYDGVANRHVYLGSDGGIADTANALAATSRSATAACSTSSGFSWTSRNTGYAVTEINDGAIVPGGATYFVGTQDNGTLRGTSAGGQAGWTTVDGGDGGVVAVDPSNTNVVYDEQMYLSLNRSSDGGQTWASATSGITEPAANFQFVAPYTLDPSTPTRLWTGGRVLWRTSNGASTWVQASAVLPGTATSGLTSAVAVAPTSSGTVLAGTGEGYVVRSAAATATTAATTWASARPRSGYVSSLAFDPHNARVAYATYSTFGGTHVWRSADAGATWVGIDGAGATALPDVPVHSLVVDPSDSARLYIGTDLGVFVSLDGGTSWARELTGFATVVTQSLRLDTYAGTNSLYAFTYGRGAWRVALATGTPSPSVLAPSGLTSATTVAFASAAHAVTTSNIVLRPAGSAANIAATLACADASGTTTNCSTGVVKTARLTPVAPLTPGQGYVASVNPSGSAPALVAAGTAVPPASLAFRASTVEEETSPAARWTWRALAAGSTFSGSYTTERAAGATATLTFSGTGAEWDTITGVPFGLAAVYVDGVLKETVNSYSPTTKYRVPHTYAGLSSGRHSLVIKVLGQKGSPSGSDTYVAIDQFRILGSTGTPSLAYQWAHVTDSGSFGGGYAKTDQAGATSSFTFRGTSVAAYLRIGPDGGRADLSIDGVAKGYVETYSASRDYDFFTLSGLTDAVHTVKLTARSDAATSSTGHVVAVDRWVVG